MNQIAKEVNKNENLENKIPQKIQIDENNINNINEEEIKENELKKMINANKNQNEEYEENEIGEEGEEEGENLENGEMEEENEGEAEGEEEESIPLVTLKFISICQYCRNSFNSNVYLPYLLKCGHFFC